MKKKVLIVIPAYNEEETLAVLLNECKNFGDVCVVNDGSRDNTAKILSSFPGITTITHKKNLHIPQTIRDGMTYALKNEYDFVITMDAGLSHLPKELPHFVEHPFCDLLVGYRAKQINVPESRKLLSVLATFLLNIAIRQNLFKLPIPWFKDLTSGYRRYSKKSIKILLSKKMLSRSFDFHSEAFMLIFRNNLSIQEIPITYVFTNSSLTLQVIIDSIKMLAHMLINKRK